MLATSDEPRILTFALCNLSCLLCLICLAGASSGKPTDENCNNAALLQVSTQPSRAKIQNPKSKAASWQDREYHLVPHHKTGTAMTHQAAENMIRDGLKASSTPLPKGVSEDDIIMASFSDTLEQVVSPAQLPSPWVEASMHGMGMATDASMMQTSHHPKCIAHISRNPFEVLASGYIYHMTGTEVWADLSFEDASTECNWKYQMPIVQEFPAEQGTCYGTYCRSMGQVMHNSLAGPVSAWLPDASPSESYTEYLNRVNLTEGLLAESLWAVNSSLKPMRFAHKFAEDSPCSINVCLSEFYEDCKSTWERILHSWELPEPQFTTLLQGALKSCPGTSQMAKEHSSETVAEKLNVTHLTEHSMPNMVALARKLDHRLLGGHVAKLEKHLGCPVSGKYKED